MVKFFYNDKGFRVRKESFNQSTGNLLYTEYYMRDVAGTVMAIYRKNTQATLAELVEVPIYGASRLGVYHKGGATNYELTDHLGNVRALVTKDNPTPSMFADYYPGGMQMPNRNSLNGSYRYAYQGQEKDPETGKEAFQLRLYDSRINRWLTTDPAGQYHSPYMAMGNNPVSRIDPDGGKDIYELQDDGTTKLIELTKDKFDMLLGKDGIEIGQVNKGFLSDGLNIRENGLFLDVLNKKDFQSYMSFILDLSIAENKEVAGFIFDDSSNFDDIFITPYKNNTYKSSPGLVTFKNNGNNIISERIYKVGASFHRANSWFHTHPGGTGFGVASGDSRPSRGDLNFTKEVKVPGLILSTFGGIGFIRSNGVQFNNDNDRWRN